MKKFIAIAASFICLLILLNPLSARGASLMIIFDAKASAEVIKFAKEKDIKDFINQIRENSSIKNNNLIIDKIEIMDFNNSTKNSPILKTIRESKRPNKSSSFYDRGTIYYSYRIFRNMSDTKTKQIVLQEMMYSGSSDHNLTATHDALVECASKSWSNSSEAYGSKCKLLDQLIGELRLNSQYKKITMTDLLFNNFEEIIQDGLGNKYQQPSGYKSAYWFNYLLEKGRYSDAKKWLDGGPATENFTLNTSPSTIFQGSRLNISSYGESPKAQSLNIYSTEPYTGTSGIPTDKGRICSFINNKKNASFIGGKDCSNGNCSYDNSWTVPAISSGFDINYNRSIIAILSRGGVGSCKADEIIQSLSSETKIDLTSSIKPEALISNKNTATDEGANYCAAEIKNSDKTLISPTSKATSMQKGGKISYLIENDNSYDITYSVQTEGKEIKNGELSGLKNSGNIVQFATADIDSSKFGSGNYTIKIKAYHKDNHCLLTMKVFPIGIESYENVTDLNILGNKVTVLQITKTIKAGESFKAKITNNSGGKLKYEIKVNDLKTGYFLKKSVGTVGLSQPTEIGASISSPGEHIAEVNILDSDGDKLLQSQRFNITVNGNGEALPSSAPLEATLLDGKITVKLDSNSIESGEQAKLDIENKSNYDIKYQIKVDKPGSKEFVVKAGGEIKEGKSKNNIGATIESVGDHSVVVSILDMAGKELDSQKFGVKVLEKGTKKTTDEKSNNGCPLGQKCNQLFSTPTTSTDQMKPSSIGNITDLLDRFLIFLELFLGSLGFVALVITGYQFIASAGNPATVETAKKNLTWTIIGVVIGTLSLVITKIIFDVLTGRFNPR